MVEIFHPGYAPPQRQGSSGNCLKGRYRGEKLKEELTSNVRRLFELEKCSDKSFKHSNGKMHPYLILLISCLEQNPQNIVSKLLEMLTEGRQMNEVQVITLLKR